MRAHKTDFDKSAFCLAEQIMFKVDGAEGVQTGPEKIARHG